MHTVGIGIIDGGGMIRIDSYLHRTALSELIRRWMYDKVDSADAEFIAQLINFNHLYVLRYLQGFTERIFPELYPTGIIRRQALRKGDVKDALVARPPYRNERIDELISNYRDFPENFYRDTPFHGMVFFTHRDGVDECIGSSRIKRARRLAEKTARRIIDRVFVNIKRRADVLADERAQRLGIPREHLLTPLQEMEDEFHRAETRLIEDLRHGRPFEGQEDLVINDVAGIKMILDPPPQQRLMDLIESLPESRIIDVEFHNGNYNATNLIIGYRPDRERILAQPVGGITSSLLQARGMQPGQIQQAFTEFVLTGEEEVSLEIIVSNYEETLESEIGRCIHEDRIIKQRLTQQYRGHLSKNIEYLMEYLFAFPMSSQRELNGLPIKLWNRYLPDYFDEVLKDLFHIPTNGMMDEAAF
jgi:hypothetical protein